MRNFKNELLVVMTVEEIYRWNLTETTRLALGALTQSTPLCRKCIGGGSSTSRNHVEHQETARILEYLLDKGFVRRDERYEGEEDSRTSPQ